VGLPDLCPRATLLSQAPCFPLSPQEGPQLWTELCAPSQDLTGWDFSLGAPSPGLSQVGPMAMCVNL
jgi:hypothetical protein